MNKSLKNIVALSCLAGGLMASAEVLEYGTIDSPHSGGTVNVDTTLSAEGMRFALGDVALQFVGDGSIALSSGAWLTNHHGQVHFAVPLTGADGLSFDIDAVLIRSSGAVTSLTTTDQLLFPNADLSRMIPVGGLHGGTVNKYATAYNPKRTETTLRVQYQEFYSPYVKSVEVEYTQKGMDVYGRLTGAYFFNPNYGMPYVLGCDVEELHEDHPDIVESTFVGGSGGYGLVYADMLVVPEQSEYVLENDFQPAGTVEVGKGALLTLVGSSSGGTGELSFGEKVVVDDLACFSVTNWTSFSFAGGFVGRNGELRFGPPATSDYVDVSFAGDLSHGAGEVLIAENQTIADLMGVSDCVCSSGAGTICCYEHNGSSVTFQAQVAADPWNKCVMAELFDKNGHIYGRVPKAPYQYLSICPIGTDFRKITPEAEQGGYKITKMTLRLPQRREGTVSGTCALTNMTVCVGAGQVLNVLSASFMPEGSESTVEVCSNAILALKASCQADGRARKIVRKGGVMRAEANNVFPSTGTRNTPILVDGGVLGFAFKGNTGEEDDAYTYIPGVELRDGAQMSGYRPRMRGGVTFKVGGDAPSTWACGGIGLYSSSITSPIMFDVEDVTRDVKVDFFATGTMADWDNTPGMAFKKTGDGTMRIDKAWTTGGGTFTIAGGELCLGVSSALKATKSLSLSGGNLSVAGGTSQTLSALALTATGALTVGSGATVSFADSSSVVWAEGVRLNVIADLQANAVRFGTTASGLTESQQKAMRCGKSKCYLDADGYLRAYPPSGLILLLK